MTDVRVGVDEYGKKALDPLRPAPSLDRGILAQEKARFLLQAETLRHTSFPGDSEKQLKRAERKNQLVRGKLSLNFYKALGVIVLVFALVAGSSISVYAAQSSLPGEPLYNIKAVSEDLRLSLTRSPQAKLKLTIDYTNRRVSELQDLVAGGQSLPDQTSVRYQQELEDALHLAAQMDDQQMGAALTVIKTQAEKQGMTLEELIDRLPAQASPAIIHLQERLQEQVQWSAFGEQNPQEFRLQVHERAQNRKGPKHSPTSDQPGLLPAPGTVTPSPDKNENGNGNGQPNNPPGHGNSGNGQGQNPPGNGNHSPNPTP